MNETQTKIAAIIQDQLGCAPMTESDFYDPEFLHGTSFDSLDMIELVMKVEEDLCVSISDDEADPFNPNDLGTTKPLAEFCAMVDAKRGKA